MMIVDVRRLVAEALAPLGKVYRLSPDDVAEVPCLVVGRPSVTNTGPGAAVLSVPVTIIGNRVGSDDAQDELDAMADAFVDVVGLGIPTLPGSRFTGMDPVLVTVAATEYPAYVADITIPRRIGCTT